SRRLFPALLPALVLGLAGCLAALRVAPAWFLAAPPRAFAACSVTGVNPTRPSTIHFQPGLVEHGNWIEFPVRANPAPNRWALCVDGRVIGSIPSFVQDGTVRFNLQTRFVNLLWLGGRLDDYARPDAWLLFWQ